MEEKREVVDNKAGWDEMTRRMLEWEMSNIGKWDWRLFFQPPREEIIIEIQQLEKGVNEFRERERERCERVKFCTLELGKR